MNFNFPTWIAVLFCSLFAQQAAIATPHRFESKRPDGSTIHWTLDLPDQHKGTSGLAVLMQGSGCSPIAQSRAMLRARSAFPEFAALTIEKYGIHPDYKSDNDKGDLENCPQEYHANSNHSQRVADYLQILSELAGWNWWNGRLVLFGGSEGGDIATMLAVRSKPDAIILMSAGGGVSFGEMMKLSILDDLKRRSVPQTQWPDYDALFARARANPQSAEVEEGYSLRYWADSIDYRAVEDMLKLTVPILLIQGSADTDSPVVGARKAVEAFTMARRCNLTYWELTGYDHSMADSAGVSRLGEVLDQAALWARQQLSQPSTSDCMKPPS